LQVCFQLQLTSLFLLFRLFLPLLLPLLLLLNTQ
jgi:hypothetical protein